MQCSSIRTVEAGTVVTELSRDLQTIVTAVRAGDATRLQMNRLVKVCHALSISIVRYKISYAKLETRFHYSSYPDIAYDIIAELFRRDEYGQLVKIKNYFEGIPLLETTDEDILAHLRRLVNSRVNQEIFRIYAEIDPGLSKVLRNIKLAVQEHEHFQVILRTGEWYILPTLSEPNAHLPVVDYERLIHELAALATGGESIPELLKRLSLYLREQETHARFVLVMTVARAFRFLISRDDSILQETYPDDRLLVEGAEAVIRETCRRERERYLQKYVEQKRVKREVFESYFGAIEETMLSHFLDNDGSDQSLFERLHVLRPEITHDEYYEKHRSVVEYLARLTRTAVAEQLKKELNR